MTSAVPDHPERTFATDVGRSVIVQAPAGSGKTTLLVTRCLRLLTIVDAPEQILAITFTRKAASEVRSRVLEALTAAADADADPADPAVLALARSRELGWDLLDSPGRLKIQTIDAFAMSLSRGLPITSGFDPTAAFAENAAALYERAVNRLLQRLYEDHALSDEIADFLRQCDNDAARAANLLGTMLGKRDQWLAMIADVVATHRAHPDAVARTLELGLTSLVDEVVHRFEALLEPGEASELEQLSGQAARQLGRQLESNADRYRLIGELMTTAKGEFRKQLTRRDGFPPELAEEKSRMLGLIERFRERSLEQQAANLRHLPDSILDQQSVERLINVCVNLALANAELSDVFREAGVQDFTTLVLNAQAALGAAQAPTDLALALDYRIRHILVDEFQDTSVSQFRLFESMLDGWTEGDGSTFFAVGDPMQSIYRFRDAEVGLFFEAWEHGIGNVKLEPVVLSSNFRAVPGLVRWTNHVFRQVMGSRQDPVLGRIGYRPAAPTWTSDEGADPAVALSLHPDRSSEVDAVVDRIEALLGKTDDSLAVLVRNRGHLTELLRALRHRGIAWHANDVDPLMEKPVVRDLLAIIGTLHDPWDRLTWFSLLRSPLVGFTLADLQSLTSIEHLDDLLARREALDLSASGRMRLERLGRAWQASATKLDEAPPRSVVETLWILLGGLDAYDDPAALVHATRLLELVDELGHEGLSPTAVREAATGLYAADISDSRLEIMTIHKAKGLEFDHVLLPFLDRVTTRDEPELLLWRALPQGLLMGIRGQAGPYDWLAREDRLRERHEWQRLLYVACTRARLSLSLFAAQPPDTRPPESSMLRLLLPAIDGAPEMRVERQQAVIAPVQADFFDNPAPGLARLFDEYAFVPPLHPIPPREAQHAFPASDSLDRRTEVVLGLVVHAVLEQLAHGRLPDDPNAWIAAQQTLWAREAARHALEPEDVASVIAECSRQVSLVLDDPDGRWILQGRPDGHAEYRITGIFDDRPENYVLDRTFTAEGTRWLIDYKTAVPRPGDDVDAFIASELARYRGQLARYAILAEAVFGQQPRVAIYFTALPRLVRL